MTSRLLPHPLLTPILALIWLLLANSLSPGHILLGLLLGWSIPVFTLRFWPDAGPHPQAPGAAALPGGGALRHPGRPTSTWPT
jgi:multisubunit Na+/H+ antiporter MnhE subunit